MTHLETQANEEVEPFSVGIFQVISPGLQEGEGAATPR